MSQDWWRHAVIYQVYVRSFADSNGDGIGDLPGIRSRLPYLRDLGVDAVWITPFYASPMADGGYDVADYRAVDPQFGGLDDVRALVADAHTLGIRVIVDIVPNHSSDQHEWFQEALAGRGRERYIRWPDVGASATSSARASATSLRTTGSPCSAGRRGHGSPTVPGTCTCSRPSSRT